MATKPYFLKYLLYYHNSYPCLQLSFVPTIFKQNNFETVNHLIKLTNYQNIDFFFPNKPCNKSLLSSVVKLLSHRNNEELAAYKDVLSSLCLLNGGKGIYFQYWIFVYNWGYRNLKTVREYEAQGIWSTVLLNGKPCRPLAFFVYYPGVNHGKKLNLDSISPEERTKVEVEAFLCAMSWLFLKLFSNMSIKLCSKFSIRFPSLVHFLMVLLWMERSYPLWFEQQL